MSELSFLAIIGGTIAYLDNYKRALVKVSLPAFFLLLLIDLSSLLELTDPAGYLISIFTVAVQTIFAINIHRVLILGPEAVSRWGVTSWTMRETLFTAYVILTVIITIPVVIFAAIPFIGILIALVGMCWIFGRSSLVFPGIATDHEMSIGKSWDMTKDHQITMTLVVALLPVLLGLVVGLLDNITDALLFTSVLSTLATGVTVAALSTAFKMITTLQAPKGEQRV